MQRHAPLALVVDVELEDTVPVGHAERDRILARLAWHRRQRRADVRVEHREFELHVLDARVWFPDVLVWVELRDMQGEDLT